MLLFSGEGIVGVSANNVILVNDTGLKIVRVVVGNRTYEDIATKDDKVFITVAPGKHHLGLVFRGGVHVDWKNFDFSNVHQITFDLAQNKVSAHPE